MKNISLIIFALGFSTLFLFLKPADMFAIACPGVPPGGDYTVSTSCTFGSAVDGVDQGTGSSNTANLIIASNQTLTINPGQTIVFGGSIIVNGTIVVSTSGQIRQTALWVEDPDGDGYPAATNPPQLAQSSSPGDTYRRRNTQISLTSADCDTTSNLVFQTKNIAGGASGNGDFDQDGYSNGAAGNRCVGYVCATVSGRDYYMVSQDQVCKYLDAAHAIGFSDCNDVNTNIFANQNVATDVDHDGYAPVGASSQCAGASISIGGKTYYRNSAGDYYFLASDDIQGYDCDDNNNNKPSFDCNATQADWNCDGTTEACSWGQGECGNMCVQSHYEQVCCGYTNWECSCFDNRWVCDVWEYQCSPGDPNGWY